MTVGARWVIPCYNEEARLPVAEYRKWLERGDTAGLLFVDDGSGDGTWRVLEDLKAEFPQRVTTLRLRQNVGKAEAVRRGAVEALESPETAVTGYLDADLATPLSELDEMRRILVDHHLEMVMGARLKRLGAAIDRYASRHYLGRVLATLIGMSLGLPVYDTQCGAKVLTRRLAEEVFAEPFMSRWLMDVEILFRMISRHGEDWTSRVTYEHPLRIWTEKGRSTVRILDVAKIPMQVFRLRRRYRNQGATGQAGAIS